MEDSHARETNAWGLDRQDYNKTWSQIMYPMQGSPSENEPSASELVGFPYQGFSEAIIGLIACAGGVVIIHRLMAGGEDELQLHVLHGTIKVLQSIARFFGAWALNAEKTYNDYVETLH